MDRLTSTRPWSEAQHDLAHEMGYSYIWVRLQQYENTGFSPEEVERCKMEREYAIMAAHGRCSACKYVANGSRDICPRCIYSIYEAPEGGTMEDLWEWRWGQEKISSENQHTENARTPCDMCRFFPPSSGDGKPCGICPAEVRR